jgi:hypothetical protein
VIFAVTSWGYTNESIKIQGSSPLTGPKGDDPNNFRGMYNSMCDYSRGIHGANSCELLN